MFSIKATSPEEERALLRRKRSSLRLLSDLAAAGVSPAGPQPLLGVVTELAVSGGGGGLRKDREGGQAALALLSHFAKGARESLLGLQPALPSLPDAVKVGVLLHGDVLLVDALLTF